MRGSGQMVRGESGIQDCSLWISRLRGQVEEAAEVVEAMEVAAEEAAH